jgi:hypothetical protein
MKNDPVIDYILKSEGNLNVAAAVTDAWPKVTSKLVSAFLERLGSRLKRKGWQSEPWGRPFLDQWAGFGMWKPAWSRSVSFQCGQYGNSIVLGVSRDTDDTEKLPLHGPLLSAVQKILPSAKPSPWWEACASMPSPAPDWRKPEVLWRIHTDPKFLTDVADQLFEIAEVSAPIIDELAKKRAKSR